MRARWPLSLLVLAGCSVGEFRSRVLPEDVTVIQPDLPVTMPDRGPADTGPSCDATMCGDACADLARDPRHCGACDNDCTALPGVNPATVQCTAGACVIAATSGCAANRGDCDNAPSNGCETDLTRADNCGACRARCLEPSPECAINDTEHYACLARCPGDQRRCSDGTSYRCVDLATSLGDCGACGNVCRGGVGATPTCAGGRCGVTCATGFADCNGMAMDGCEVSLMTSATHCGDCARVCTARDHATAACVAGSCGAACTAGWGDCDGDPANGCETDLTTNADHCRVCGNRCPRGDHATATCMMGACRAIRCATGFSDCDGDPTTGCEASTQDDASNCGACGATCPSGPSGRASCAAGRCALACAAGTGNCDGAAPNGCEVNLNTSVDHCGACPTVCPTRANADRVCRAGVCAFDCQAGFADCDGNPVNGCEADLAADANNCDRCGQRCLACVAHTCVM